MISVRDLRKTRRVHRKAPGLMGSARGLFRREYLEKHAVAGVSLEAGEGEIVGVVGANGAGKTTLVKMLAGLINRGDVDYCLVRPVSSLFFLSLREFAANSFVNLLMATGILVWALARYPGELAALEVAIYVVMLVLGCLVGAFFDLWFTIPAFWLHWGNGLRQVMMQLHPCVERPHQIFPGWLQRILLTALPLALVSSYPTWVLFSGVTVAKVGFFLAVPVAAGGFTVVFWRLGVRNYASASS